MRLVRLEEATNGAGGGKAAGLRWLSRQGVRVPPTWVMLEPIADRRQLFRILAPLGDSDCRFAVRSSANVEDGGGRSYAGQFTTVVDVAGLDQLVEAAVAVIQSGLGDGVGVYRRQAGDDRPIEMGVVIQEMVEPVVSGIAFSKNPVTGISEVIIELAPGPGTGLVDGRVTPDRWVHRWGDFVETPATDHLGAGVVASLVATIGRLADAYGAPLDLEWVFDGSEVWWVQARPITGLDGHTIYSRRIAKEVMPGIILPLVWSVNVPMVNTAWVQLFREALGRVDIEPEDLARSFGYRSYFNMTAIGEIFAALGMPRESLELLLGLPAGSDQPRFKPTAKMMTKLPRMTAMMLRLSGYGRKVDRLVPEFAAEYRRFAERELETIDDGALLAEIEELHRIGVRAARANIITPLLANLYASMFGRALRRHGVDQATVDLTAGFDMTPFDPTADMSRIAADIAAQDPTVQEAILQDGMRAVPDALVPEVEAFLDKFGHLSDSGNDFSVPPWREIPDTVVRLIASQAKSPRSSSRLHWREVRPTLPRRHRPIGGLLHRRAGSFMHRREAVSSVYTFGYGQFRRHFLEVGRRLAGRAVLAEGGDVMYLTLAEVQSALMGTDRTEDLAEIVATRKAEVAGAGSLEVPDVIYGDDFVARPPLDPHATTWTGTATSRGYHVGPVRVVRGLADFERVEHGDVVAIPYSDAGWTPLFTRAGAVVAESGGMLSHSSIVARENGIPCVVSVARAMQIPEGAFVSVDGHRGLVILEDMP
jgi:phosphohistidine swiveling domain-containing protein